MYSNGRCRCSQSDLYMTESLQNAFAFQSDQSQSKDVIIEVLL